MSHNSRKENEPMSKDQVIEQQRLIIDKLKMSNEKLQRKLEYYENFLENIVQFEKTQNLVNMKAFTKANLQKFDILLEESYRAKEELEIEKMTAAELRAKLNLKSAHELSAVASQVGKEEGGAVLGERIMKLENQVKTLNKENEQLNDKNKRLLVSLNKKDFFNEYELLLKEVEGLRKQNLMTQEKLRQKQEPVPR